jgi:hypothetical protein
MGLDRIVCLANSYKHDNRCVAGISLVSKKWVRLVSRKVPGCVTRAEASYSNGQDVALLDVFEAELADECCSNCHPEDVYVTEKPWRLLHHLDEEEYTNHLQEYVSKRPSVLQGYNDRVSAERVMDMPRERSLELIQPEDLWWWIREENGKRKNRAVFRVSRESRVRYDLAVTDPGWLDQLQLLPAAIYPHAFFFRHKPPRTYLTMSLSEPFEGFHYKLVAGVVTCSD